MKFTVYILVRKKGEPAVITGKSRCKKSIIIYFLIYLTKIENNVKYL